MNVSKAGDMLRAAAEVHTAAAALTRVNEELKNEEGERRAEAFRQLVNAVERYLSLKREVMGTRAVERFPYKVIWRDADGLDYRVFESSAEAAWFIDTLVYEPYVAFGPEGWWRAHMIRNEQPRSSESAYDAVKASLRNLRALGGNPEENAVALLTGLSVARIRELGGVGE